MLLLHSKGWVQGFEQFPFPTYQFVIYILTSWVYHLGAFKPLLIFSPLDCELAGTSLYLSGTPHSAPSIEFLLLSSTAQKTLHTAERSRVQSCAMMGLDISRHMTVLGESAVQLRVCICVSTTMTGPDQDLTWTVHTVLVQVRARSGPDLDCVYFPGWWWWSPGLCGSRTQKRDRDRQCDIIMMTLMNLWWTSLPARMWPLAVTSIQTLIIVSISHTTTRDVVIYYCDIF